MATAGTPSRVKRKHTGYKLDFKMQVLKEVDKKSKLKKDICAEFGLSGSTFSTFIKDREKIEKAFYTSTIQPDRIRMRQVDEDRRKVEEALFAWFAQARDANITITGDSIVEMARQTFHLQTH